MARIEMKDIKYGVYNTLNDEMVGLFGDEDDALEFAGLNPNFQACHVHRNDWTSADVNWDSAQSIVSKDDAGDKND